MKVAIIGLGLIGGSWGLALKEWAKSEEGKTAGLEIVGFDAKGAQRHEAERLKAVDRTTPTPMEAVKDASVVIVATPVVAIRETFEDIAPVLMNGAVVTDVASTKRDVLRWAKELLPTTVSFVGGHPMAGKTASLEEADPTLFKGCTYCLIPAENAKEEAIDAITRLVEIIGAKPHFIDEIEHDTYVASISHLPFLSAATLVNLATGSEGWREISRLASTGFQDTTRLASGSTQMWLDICRTNSDSIINWLDRYQDQLSSLRAMIEMAGLRDERGRSRSSESTNPEPLKAYLEKAKEGRDKIQLAKQQQQKEENFETVPMPSKQEMRGEMSRLFTGGIFNRRKRDDQK